MKTAYREELHLSPKNVIQLNVINEIIDEYAEQGYTLTLRQLYYQLVSRDIIANKVAEYAKLSDLLVKGRMAGVVDWDAIEDRVRVPKLPYWVRGISSALDDTVEQYRLDRQEGQDNYIELWVEKDALSGVLSPITEKYHINLMVNRGYSSCTAMHDAFERIERAERKGKTATILYLGDHDPSGLDMVRDIEARLNEFGVSPEVVAIGLTMAQIKKYNPPPNPAKITDPRAKEYIRNYGQKSWEVDALNPKTLNELVKKNVESRIDMDKYEEQVQQEEEDKEELRGIAQKFEDGE